jgi:hypothetical protein
VNPKDVLRIVLSALLGEEEGLPPEFEQAFVGPDDLYIDTTDGRQFALHAREVIRPPFHTGTRARVGNAGGGSP